MEVYFFVLAIFYLITVILYMYMIYKIVCIIIDYLKGV